MCCRWQCGLQTKAVSDLSYILTERENGVRITLDKKYRELAGQNAENDIDLCYFLGDSADYQTWSYHSGRIPTMRLNNGLFWWPALKRFSIPKEKLLFLGMPVDHVLTQSLGVPCLGATEVDRAAVLAGNAMHLGNVALIELLTFSCFGEIAAQHLVQ